MKHVVRVWAYDRPGDHQIKEGDVISVRKYNGRSDELLNGVKGDLCSIAFIVDGLTAEDVIMMTSPEYPDGKTSDQVEEKYESDYKNYLDSCSKTMEKEFDKLGRPVLDDLGIQKTHPVYTPTENSLPLPEVPVPIGKRKYNIPFEIIKKGWCPDLDIKKVRDSKAAYRPEITEVDATEKVAFCKDKFTDKFKYSKEKVI